MKEKIKMINNDIKVQIVCVTYNQKEYIKDALDSFLMQKTNFKFEVLVGDDCSTDGTSEIVAEYAKQYPDIIKHIRRTSNMGCLANFMDLCESITAKYAAFCDGDDYWSNENKLQKQFDYMEKNKNVAICSHLSEVRITYDCPYLHYYKKQKRGLVIPSRLPLEKKLTASDVIEEIPHMSSLFIRWNIGQIPDWCKRDGKCGDYPIIFFSLGDSYLYVIKEKMSVYRKSETGVFSQKESQYLFFINTRPEYFKLLTGFIKYYEKNYPTFQIKNFKKRLLIELSNYLNAIIETEKWEKLFELKERYPEIYKITLSLLKEYKYKLQQIDKLGTEQANLLRKNSTLKIIKPILQSVYAIKKTIKNLQRLFKQIHSFFAYWIFAIIPKKKNLWVFTGFNMKSYSDNTKYLYEYIIMNHPEIEAIWLTKSKEIQKKLKEAKMPVCKANSLYGIWMTARASIAFSNHFKMSDYDNRYGFNAKTKFVNLWHGIGLKDMRPVGDKIPNMTIPGVRLSSDIIINKDDSLFVKIQKTLKYFFVAPFRELYEKYFLIICPGQQFKDYNAIPWQIPKDAQFLCGYPRNINLYKSNLTDPKNYNILYAPAYRWNLNDEECLINIFINSIECINDLLEKNNATFTLKLHPRTWKNYGNIILTAIKDKERFLINKENDIYTELQNYSLLITDYSTLGYDFLLTGKPLVFMAFDKEQYQNNNKFSMPYEENCPGDVVTSWTDALLSVEKSYNNPGYNKEIRDKISDLFVPKKYNDINNSKRIVEEIERRLKIRRKND